MFLYFNNVLIGQILWTNQTAIYPIKSKIFTGSDVVYYYNNGQLSINDNKFWIKNKNIADLVDEFDLSFNFIRHIKIPNSVFNTSYFYKTFDNKYYGIYSDLYNYEHYYTLQNDSLIESNDSDFQNISFSCCDLFTGRYIFTERYERYECYKKPNILNTYLLTPENLVGTTQYFNYSGEVFNSSYHINKYQYLDSNIVLYSNFKSNIYPPFSSIYSLYTIKLEYHYIPQGNYKITVDTILKFENLIDSDNLNGLFTYKNIQYTRNLDSMYLYISNETNTDMYLAFANNFKVDKKTSGYFGFSIDPINNLKENYYDKSNIRIFPNPNNGNFTLNFEGNSSYGNTLIKLLNINGQEIFSKNYKQLTGSNFYNVNCNDLSSGIYYIQIQTSNTTQFKKINVFNH